MRYIKKDGQANVIAETVSEHYDNDKMISEGWIHDEVTQLIPVSPKPSNDVLTGAKTAYADATTTEQRLNIIAQRLGLV